ncbi:MAG TPA: TolC family protein, partial [Holophagaceae bacterium]|nr:TolC family protein [Holophagaceae bacterium]
AQRAADLEAQDQTLVAELDRLTGRPAGAPLDTPSTLDTFPLPVEPDPGQAAEQALAISPELTEAQHHLEHYRQQVRLAHLDLRPDFTVGATYMPQGSLPGMWSVSVGFNVPIWSGRKQRQALAGAEAESEMQDQRLADLRQRLEAATRARAARLSADLRIVRLYEAGLLAQSDAAYRAALNQYAAGAAPFRAVLEALSGRLQDQSDHLEARARACFDSIDLARALPDAAPSPASMTGGAR